MSESPAWRVLHERHLASYRVFGVTELGCTRVDTGHTQTFYRIDSVDWANVVALTDAGEIVMVRQHRFGLGHATLEIPGGLVDPGESPIDTAARELVEETGYRARTIVEIGNVSPNPALFGNRLHSFLATGCTWVGDIANDHDEHTVVELVPASEIDDRLRSGEIDHALVMAAFHWWRLRGSPTA